MPTPRRPASLSQNFLVNRKLISRLIRASSISPHDWVLDIGAGDGNLTQALLTAAQHVIAIEVDQTLFRSLQERFAGVPNLTLANADFLDYPLPQRLYKVFANIPFCLTGAIIRKLLDSDHAPVDCYLVVQAEAATKFIAHGDSHSLAAILYYPWWDIRIAHRFQRADFRPRPSVDCVLLRLERRAIPFLTERESLYRDFVAYHFADNRQATFIAPDQWIQRFTDWARHRHGKSNPIRGAFARLQRQQARLAKIHRTRTDPYWNRSK